MCQQLTRSMRALNSEGPVKQRRALLESNPPRDNWIEGDEIKTVSTSGEAKTSPDERFISEPSHALKNSSQSVRRFYDGPEDQKPLRKNYVNSYPFFRSKRTSLLVLLSSKLRSF